PDGLRPDDSVHSDVVAQEHKCLLQQPVRGRRPHVDSHVEDLGCHGFIIKAPISVLRVEVPVVDGDGVLTGEVGNVQFGVAPTADTPFGLPARVPGVVDVAALVLEDYFHRGSETLIRTHGVPPFPVSRSLRYVATYPSAAPMPAT